MLNRTNTCLFLCIFFCLFNFKFAFAGDNCSSYENFPKPAEGIVFKHKDWYVKQIISGVEWVGVDCIGYIYHSVVYACTKNQEQELCIWESHGRVSIEAAYQIIIDNYLYKVDDLFFKNHVSSDQSESDLAEKSRWVRLLANTKKPIFANIEGKVFEFSGRGASAALRKLSLIE